MSWILSRANEFAKALNAQARTKKQEKTLYDDTEWRNLAFTSERVLYKLYDEKKHENLVNKMQRMERKRNLV